MAIKKYHIETETSMHAYAFSLDIENTMEIMI